MVNVSKKIVNMVSPTRLILFGLPHPVLRPEVLHWSLPILSMASTLDLYPVLWGAYSRVFARSYPVLTLVFIDYAT